MTEMDNGNKFDYDGNQPADFDNGHGADPKDLVFKNETPLQDAGRQLNTTPGPGVSTPEPTPELAQQMLRDGGRQNQNTAQPDKEVVAKHYLSPLQALAEGFFGQQNSQLEERKVEPKKSAAEEEAERLAKAKSDLEEDPDADEEVSDQLQAAIDEDKLDEEEDQVE